MNTGYLQFQIHLKRMAQGPKKFKILTFEDIMVSKWNMMNSLEGCEIKE